MTNLKQPPKIQGEIEINKKKHASHADFLTKESIFNKFIYNLQSMMSLDGTRLKTEGNVLLAYTENMQYAVTLEVLHMAL